MKLAFTAKDVKRQVVTSYARRTKQQFTFEQWKVAVAQYMGLTYGMYPDDLPDYGYADVYHRGDSVKDAAKDAYEAASEF